METERMKKYTLIVVTLASFLTPFMGSAINLAIPAMGKYFNSSSLFLSWVATSYILASAAFLVPFGRLADIIGRKKIFTLGIILFAFSSLMCGLSWSMQALLVFRVFQGIGSAMIFSISMAILTSVFPPQERGKVLGINIATVYTGLSLGPVLGGTLNHHFGWQSIFFFTTLIALFAIGMTVTKLKGAWAGRAEESFDYLGAFLYIAGLISFMYGISSVVTAPSAKYLLVLGIIVLVLFAWYEMRIKDPILNLTLFKNVPFAFSNLAALINYSATFAVGFVLSLYLQEVKGYDSQMAGLILLFQPVIMALLSPVTGTLSDRVEPRILATAGMALTTLGLVFFCFISQTTPVWLITANLALLGTGFALFSSPNSSAIMGSVNKRFYATASSTMGTMRMIGQAISMAIVTLVMALFVGNVQLTPAFAGKLVSSSRIAFIVFALICFGGIFASSARGKVHPGTGQEDGYTLNNGL
ncbi:MFS transporter [Candidatus Formimonas warabiya]|uniref:MFS transporter n=1 Tax=Formimonas warabiya TaxID=1761012 RepID=A0A3G1KXG9_FORW1|nr:MFS transporter [Candidatus Formimonas warabiya]ATW27223.1 MFS transporter [Candidatus Formimonas warabiya]